jgi:hypothetical protein
MKRSARGASTRRTHGDAVNDQRRTPASLVPYALVARSRFLDPRVIRVPQYVRSGWLVIARDSQVPLVLSEGQWFDPQMAFTVHAYRHDADYYKRDSEDSA